VRSIERSWYARSAVDGGHSSSTIMMSEPIASCIAIDSSGELPGGKRFAGPAQLITLLKRQEGQFTRNLAEKLLTYALGRGLEPYDRCNVTEIAERVSRKGHRFSAVATEVVLSEPFRKRQAPDMPRAAAKRMSHR
jgi:hypothetical protein